MARSGFLAGLVSLIGLTACATNGPTVSEEPSGPEQGAGESAQEIGGDGASTYYIVTRPDYRKCAYPFCGGVFVKAVNQRRTLCATGEMDAQCHAVVVDLSATGLDDAAAEDFSAAFTQSQGIVRGELKLIPNENDQRVKTLVATEAWRAADEAAPTGTFYGVTSNGVQCITYPCATLDEEELNTGAAQSIHDLDLSATGADEGETAKAQAALSGTGILVAGTHESFTGPGGTGTRLVGSALYLRLEPEEQGEKACGDAVCGEGLECCNASCGWCAPPGTFCIQIACLPTD